MFKYLLVRAYLEYPFFSADFVSLKNIHTLCSNSIAKILSKININVVQDLNRGIHFSIISIRREVRKYYPGIEN